jgi:hypothetical protein
MGGWRKLHNEELRDLYYSTSIIRIIDPRKMRWAGHKARMEANRNVYKLLIRKRQGRRPVGRRKHTCVDNIKMGLIDIGWGGVDWIGLAQDRSN